MIVKVCKLKEIDVSGVIHRVGIDTIEPVLPTYGKEGDSCMDIYPIQCEYDTKRDRYIYHTGLAFAIGDDNGFTTILEKSELPNEMELRPRSNLTKSEYYCPNSPMTLDYGYRGELLIVFKNRTANNLITSIEYLTTAIEKLSLREGAYGQISQYTSMARKQLWNIKHSIVTPPYKCDGVDRCCQLLIRSSERIQWQEVESVEELGVSERGTGGFGSTGGAVN